MAGQFEEADVADVVSREFRIKREKRQKYVCSCGECIETALGSDKPIPGGRYSLAFAATVARDKYEDHAPLARQVKQMARLGLAVTSQTLWDQILALSRHLGPSHEALRQFVLEDTVVGMDETPWRLLANVDAHSKAWPPSSSTTSPTRRGSSTSSWAIRPSPRGPSRTSPPTLPEVAAPACHREDGVPSPVGPLSTPAR